MNKKMTIFGIGKKLGAPTFLCLIIIVTAGLSSGTRFQFFDDSFILGFLFIGLGLFLSFKAGFRMMRAFKEKKLLTDGLFRITKNPMYLSHIIFTVPGLSLVFNNYLILILIPIMIILLKKLIFEEEEYLSLTFGSEYENYRKNVLIKFL